MRLARGARRMAVAVVVVAVSCSGRESSTSTTSVPRTATSTTQVVVQTTIAPTIASSTSTTVPAVTQTITRPVTDASVCEPQSARAVEFTDHTVTLFAVSREAPIPVQIIGDPAGDSFQAFALVERFFTPVSIGVSGEDVEINGNQVRIVVHANGNGVARWVLPDHSVAYVRSRGLDLGRLQTIITGLSPRDVSAAIPGFDFEAGESGLALLHEHLNTRLAGSLATVDCVSPITGFGYHITAINADPIVAYGGVIDRPVPLEVGTKDGTLIVIAGRADASAPTVADVVNADNDAWATLLANTATPDLLAGWPPAPATVPSLDDVPMMLPAAVTSGQLAVERREYADDPAELHDYGQYWFANGPGAVVLSIETKFGQTAPPEGDETSVPGWDRAVFVPSSDGYEHLWLVARSGSVSIWAHGLDRNDLAVVAASLVRRANGPGWDLDSLPDGLVAIHEGWGLGAAVRTVRSTGEQPSFEMSIIHGVPSTITTPGWFDLASIDLIDINGHRGLLWQSDGKTAVVWSPRSDLTIVLGYIGSADTATDLARSVQPVDRAAWNAHTTLVAADDGCNSMFC